MRGPPGGFARRHRPPWWPEDEPWPPSGPPGAWHGPHGRGPYLWRLGCLLGLLPLLAVAAIVPLLWLIGSGLGMVEPTVPFHFWPLRLPFVLLGVGGLVLLIRALRRTALPLADLIQAADRVANGDFSGRVREEGPSGIRALARAFNSMTARLQSDDETRRTLLADVTHELRTPLTVIQGNLEAMLDGVYPADEAHLTTTLDETQRLARRIDDLRTFALTEAGALRLRMEPTDLATLVAEATASFQEQASAAGIALTADVGADPLIVHLDPSRIREVLENLVTNALRHTPSGGTVLVRCWHDRTIATVSVADSGAGIAPDQLPHIFERFAKGAGSPGMGLGLAIARGLVEAHGGTITAESELGVGATVRFSLPLAPRA